MTTIFKKAFLACASLVLLTALPVAAQTKYVSSTPVQGSFPLITKERSPSIVVSAGEHPGVRRVAGLLAEDIGRVTGRSPMIVDGDEALSASAVIVGTIGKGGLVDRLVNSEQIDAKLLRRKRETFITTVVERPFGMQGKALVIAGSDKRGTIYGMLSLSRQIGVSPWYWWADVPVKQQAELHVLPGIHTEGEPKVRYRGIFINDEAPALSGWAFEKFGGFNSKFYEKVFELILRLRGNLLWPAMWGRMFYVEDPENARLADELGIVIGTSHHEPMMRAHAEWEKFGNGPWDYTKNPKTLEEFWRGGFSRMKDTERLVTIGMRGDGDEPMTEGTAISLLEGIVKKQREMIADVTGKPASETPQVWALYKEVQDYYDKGMRVPDDVTLLFSDDNWGNIRRLPDPSAPPRKGGYGIYYHFDYVGGPRSYKWINTTQIERVWEQMTLAYEYGADRMWIVNVGDIKPMELPTSFFLDLAWDPTAIKADDLPVYYTKWAAEQFGPANAREIGDILAKYTKYNSRRKPELLNAGTFDAEEWQRIINEWEAVEKETLSVGKHIDEGSRSAFFQIVEYPVLASANLNKMYFSTHMNRSNAWQRCSKANGLADDVERRFSRNAELDELYHRLSGGKWNHMMSQTRIGYTDWQQPEENVMPKVVRTEGTDCLQVTEVSADTPSSFLLSVDPTRFQRSHTPSGGEWVPIPNLGRTGSSITLRPSSIVNAKQAEAGSQLEYDVDLPSGGDVTVQAYFSPTLDFLSLGGLRYSVAFDGNEPVAGNLHKDWSEKRWEQTVSDNINIVETHHRGLGPGKHTLRYTPLSPGLVLQKIVVWTGKPMYSYLGPPETRRTSQITNKENR